MAVRIPSKIGFVSTQWSDRPLIAKYRRNSFELALDSWAARWWTSRSKVITKTMGRSGRRQAEDPRRCWSPVRQGRLIVGIYLGERALASLKTRVDFADLPISANAGPSQLAGEWLAFTCFPTSWQKRTDAGGDGTFLNQNHKGINRLF